MVLKVRKERGRWEHFDVKKLARAISRSGVKFGLAREIANSVRKKIRKRNTAYVRSSTIRKHVLNELKKEKPNIYDSFKRYGKPSMAARRPKSHPKRQQKAKLRSKKILGGHRSSRKNL